MIARFEYAIAPPDEHVILHMSWQGDQAGARVMAPDWVVDALAERGFPMRGDDEFVGLAMALSYGVLVASLAGADLTLSGDRSAWPTSWGMLFDKPRLELVARLH